MRLIKISSPEGMGQKVIETAWLSGLKEASLYSVSVYKKDEGRKTVDVVELTASTPQAKEFSDQLIAAPYFNREEFTIAIREPRSILKSGKIKEITAPLVAADLELYEELWQFSQITFSFIARVLVSAVLISYGMIKDDLIAMAAGLMFLPYLHQILSISFGAIIGEWSLSYQGLKALMTATIITVAASAAVAYLIDQPILYDNFSRPLNGFIIAFLIGIAAVFGTSDDSGRRELIGLAITSQTTVFVVWFGVTLASGVDNPERAATYMSSYFINLLTILLVSGLTYKAIGMGKRPIMDIIRGGWGK